MSTRQLRSHLKNPATGAKRKLDFDGPDERGPPRQRPKRLPELYHCLSCLVDMPSRSFPDHNPSPACEHLINTCKKCLSGWVDAQIDQNLTVTDEKDNTVFGIKCPECSARMQPSNVRAAASRKMYQLYGKQKRNHSAETTPGWFWCQNRWCRAGAVLNDETTKVSTCANCGTDSCVPCQRPAQSRRPLGRALDVAFGSRRTVVATTCIVSIYVGSEFYRCTSNSIQGRKCGLSWNWTTTIRKK